MDVRAFGAEKGADVNIGSLPVRFGNQDPLKQWGEKVAPLVEERQEQRAAAALAAKQKQEAAEEAKKKATEAAELKAKKQIFEFLDQPVFKLNANDETVVFTNRTVLEMFRTLGMRYSNSEWQCFAPGTMAGEIARELMGTFNLNVAGVQLDFATKRSKVPFKADKEYSAKSLNKKSEKRQQRVLLKCIADSLKQSRAHGLVTATGGSGLYAYGVWYLNQYGKKILGEHEPSQDKDHYVFKK